MRDAGERCRAPALLGAVVAALLGTVPARAQQPAQAAAPRPGATASSQDTASVSYRTQDVIFISAGRTSGVTVGDTLRIMASDGQVIARAVVLSVAQQSASATLVPSGAAVTVGQRVGLVPRPHVAEAAAAPNAAAPAAAAPTPVAVAPAQPESAAAPAQPESAAAAPAAPARVPLVFRPRPRWRANFQLDQSANSSGGAQALTTYQTAAALALTAPVASWLTLDARGTTRWRNASSNLSGFGVNGTNTIVYALEARVAPPGGWWNFSLGRFLSRDAPGLGYVDGARLEVQPWQDQRIGVLAGYQPDVLTMSPSTQMAQAGVYWGVTKSTFSSSFSGSTQWQWSQIRRTWFSAQSFWAPEPGLSFYVNTDVDHGAGWESFRGFQLTNLTLGLRTALPLGFRGGLSAESHAALELFSMQVQGDTFPLPGRLTQFTASLGHDVWGSSVDLTAGYLKRATDPSPTYQGTFTIFSRHFMLVAMGQHGDLFDFGSVVLRVPLPVFYNPLMLAVSVGSDFTALPGGGQVLWRTDVRPEIGWRLGGGFYASFSGDIGRYAGLTSTYFQGGVAYQLW